MKTLDLLKDVEAYVARQPGVWDCLSLLKAVRAKIAEVDAELAATAEADAIQVKKSAQPVAWEVRNGGRYGIYSSERVARDAVFTGTNACAAAGLRHDFKIHPLYAAAQPAASTPKLLDLMQTIKDLAAVHCIDDISRREKLASILNLANDALGLKCLTCNGHGLIGGFQGGEAPGYVSEPCPDCNAPVIPAAAVAEGLERDEPGNAS